MGHADEIFRQFFGGMDDGMGFSFGQGGSNIRFGGAGGPMGGMGGPMGGIPFMMGGGMGGMGGGMGGPMGMGGMGGPMGMGGMGGGGRRRQAAPEQPDVIPEGQKVLVRGTSQNLFFL